MGVNLGVRKKILYDLASNDGKSIRNDHNRLDCSAALARCASEHSEFVAVALAGQHLLDQLARQIGRHQLDEGIYIPAQVGALFQRDA